MRPAVSLSIQSAALPHATAQLPEIAEPLANAWMSWKHRGEYHLDRNELDFALDAFTKALQDAEEQDQELIGEGLKDLGRVYLAKRQWALAAKIFNAAYAFLVESPNEKSNKAARALMIEVERCYLEKVFSIRRKLDPTIYLKRRETLKTLRQEAQQRHQIKFPKKRSSITFREELLACWMTF